MQKGYKHSEEAKQKMRAIALSRDNSKRIASLPRGENHWSWSKEPNLLTLHKRIHRKFGKARDYVCECGSGALDWAFVGIGKYTDNRDDYKPMCRKCHIKLDESWKKRDPSCYVRLKNSKGQFMKK